MSSNIKTVSIDLDDFSIYQNGLDYLLQLKEHYPGLKVSMFTIPVHYEYETEATLNIRRSTELEKVKKNLDWIQIIPHGLIHMPHEFEKADKQAMEMALKAIDEVFTKDGLPYEKGFKAPYWLWNKEVLEVLNKHNWWGAVDRNNSKMLRPDRYYQYTHSLEEPFWLSNNETINIHGHMTGPSVNNLYDCFMNLMRLPTDVNFEYVTEFIKEK